MRQSLILIILLSFILRVYGLNWDQGFHLHPDERFLTMVGNAMRFTNYFDTQTSQLNPHNIGFNFYVYGTWPVIVTKAISAIFSLDNYQYLILVGRFLSALFDVGTVALVFLISLAIFKNKLSATLAALFYSLAVLPIQLAHFFAVDTFLVFFLTLSLYLLIKKSHPVFLGIAFGLAVSAKISAILFLPIILIKMITNKKQIIPFIISLLISVRVFYPYLFDGLYLNPKVLENWQTLKSFDTPGYFPPAVQWLNFTALNSYLNTIFFGLGLPLGIIFLISLINLTKIIRKYSITGLLYLWIIGLLVYYGFQFAKPLRYLYPLYPSICILSGYLVLKIKNLKLKIITCLVIGFWSLGFMSIYAKPHSRLQASIWIHQNIPIGSTISCEYWDDCLPLIGAENYQVIQISPYDPDTPEKISNFKFQISNLDYLIFSSNRLYGGIPSAPQLYPTTSKFYSDLFNEELGFKKVAEFTSRPSWPIPGLKICLTPPYFNYGFVSKNNQWCAQPGISLIDDYAEESFTVYDHPKIIIFKKI